MLARVPGLLLLLLAVSSFSSSLAAAQNNQFNLYTTRDGLAGNFVTAIAFEANGSAWVGTTEGVTHISDAGWVSFTAAHGLGDSWVTSIAIDPDQRAWLGTQSGGIAIVNTGFKSVTSLNLNNSQIPSNFVTALAMDTQARVWVGTLDQGIALYDSKADKWTTYGVPFDSVTAIALDGDELPWVGTLNGAYHFDGTNWTQDKAVGGASVERIDAFDGKWYLTAGSGEFVLGANGWVANDSADEISQALDSIGLSAGQVTAFGKDYQQRYWLGTARGLEIASAGNAPVPPTPLPVVLIHGWTIAGDDTLETSEFRYLNNYAERDGIPLFYVRGVSPKNTLFQNAVVIRDEIARVKQATGASKVNMLAFSMGGMNTRAYLESTVYANDVNRAIILGTPQRGVELWKPILAQKILQNLDEPSAVELTPEYARIVVNETRAPNPSVAYDLLIGDAAKQSGLDFLQDMRPSDALISVESALALPILGVRKHINADLHDWGPEAVPLDLTGYLYPRATWERYLRNALRNNDNAPIGDEVLVYPIPEGTTDLSVNAPPMLAEGNHTPVVTNELAAGATVTRAVTLDENSSARFIAYFPGGQVELALVAPNGEKFEPSDLPRENQPGVLSLSTDIASFSGYDIKNAAPGAWQMILKRTDNGGAPIDVSTYVELVAPQRLNTLVQFPTMEIGARNTITGFVTMDSPTRQVVRDVALTARIAAPPATPGDAYAVSELPLYDDGLHNDGAANDGYFANDVIPTRGGWYLVFMQARGENFRRETESLFAVSPRGAAMGEAAQWRYDPPVRAGAQEPPTEMIVISTTINVERAGRYGLAATLLDNGITPIARKTMPLDLHAGANEVTMAFDAAQLGAPGVNSVRAVDVRWTLLDLQGAAIPMQTVNRALRIWR